jgi:hypothetical protein
MEKKNLQNLINDIKGSDKVNNLVSFMLERGYSLDQYINVERADKEVVELLGKYFNDEVAVDNAVVNGDEVLDMDKVSKNKKKSRSKKLEQVVNNDKKSGDAPENNKEENQMELLKKSEEEVILPAEGDANIVKDETLSVEGEPENKDGEANPTNPVIIDGNFSSTLLLNKLNIFLKISRLRI